MLTLMRETHTWHILTDWRASNTGRSRLVRLSLLKAYSSVEACGCACSSPLHKKESASGLSGLGTSATLMHEWRDLPLDRFDSWKLFVVLWLWGHYPSEGRHPVREEPPMRPWRGEALAAANCGVDFDGEKPRHIGCRRRRLIWRWIRAACRRGTSRGGGGESNIHPTAHRVRQGARGYALASA